MGIMEYTGPTKRRQSQDDEEQPLIKKVKPISIMQKSGTWRRNKATRVAKGMPTTLTDRLRVRKANIPMDQLMDLLAADTGIAVAPDNLYQLILPSASLSKRVRNGVLLKQPSGQEPMPAPKPVLLRKRSFDEDDREDDADSWESSTKQKCAVLFDDLPPPKPILKRKHSYDGDDEEDHANAWESSRKRKCTKSVTFDGRPATILGKMRASSSKEEDMERRPIGEKRACIREDDSVTVSDAIKKPKMMLVAIPLARCIKHPKQSASNLAMSSQESGPKSVPSGPSSACNVPAQPRSATVGSACPDPQSPRSMMKGELKFPAPSLPLASVAEGMKPGGFEFHSDEAVQLQQATPAPGFKLPEGCKLPEVSVENGAIPNGIAPIPRSQATTTLLRIIQDHNYLGAEGANNQQQSSAGGEMKQTQGAEGKISEGGETEDVDVCRINLSKMSISEGREAGKVFEADYKMSVFGRVEADGNIPIFADKDAYKSQEDDRKMSPSVEGDANKTEAAGFNISISAKANKTLEDNCKIPSAAEGDVREADYRVQISVGEEAQETDYKIPISVAGRKDEIPLSAAGGEAGNYKIPITAAGGEAGNCKIPISATGGEAGNCKIPLSAAGGEAGNCKIPISATGGEAGNCKIPISVAGGEAGNCKIPISVGGGEAGNCKVPITVAGGEARNCKVPISVGGGEAGNCKIPISVAGGEAGNCKVPISVAGGEAGNCKVPISAVEETQTVGCKMPISTLTNMLKSKLSLNSKLKQQARADRITANPFPMHLRNERRGRCHLQKYLFVSHCVRIIA